jgi:hypothetical protein
MKARFDSWLAVKITGLVSTMNCAYLFALLAIVSLPAAIAGGVATTIQWTAQTFLQLVLLSVIMVGQKIQADQTAHHIKKIHKHLGIKE